jgi:lysyl-tRNA synthetase class 2
LFLVYLNSVHLKPERVNADRVAAETKPTRRRYRGMETPDSTAIRAIRYDEARQRLLVRFVDGDEYAFVGVPGEVHRSFVGAESKGQFFAQEIRGRYPYNKLTQ